ncbi:cytochrome P450 [Nocardia alni]|uniref:cytochrome P450 n=1 Tax=Nocardia alni TaxID=2815723 RepID=UPI001C24DD4E|nr:cytochrome P450 [Nocardia alni]
MTDTARAGTCPAATFDDLLALREDVVRCPYGAYETQRTTAPVAYSERLGGWVVTRHNDILAVLRDTEKFSNRLASGPSSVSGLAQKIVEDDRLPERTRKAAARRMELSKSRILLFADPPLHKRQRSLVNAGFTPKRVAELDGTVEELASGLISGFPSDGPVDIVPAFTHPIPMTIIARMLGVPTSKLSVFKSWSDAFTRGVGALDHDNDAIIEMFDRVDEFYDYFTEELNKRRENPVDDLLSDLLAARLDGEEPLSEAELLQMLVQFLVAGNETTTNLLTSCVWKLATEPELQQQLRDDPDAIANFVDEVLRLESPVQGIWRVAVTDVEIGGTTVPADSLIYLVTGSANRDPEVYNEPDELDVEQTRARHLSFGRGEHACLGMNLAKLEAKVALGLLLERCPNITLAQSDDDLVFHRSFVLHGMGSLLVSVA